MRIEQFEDALMKDLAWRKMEISQLLRILSEASQKDIVIKSLILLIYAHWEGYIKKSSKYYLKYISEKRVKIKDLTINFKAIALKKYASECIDNDGLNLAKELAFISKHNTMEDKNFSINVDVDNDFDEDIINTKHNLNSKVLKNIAQIVGIKYNEAMSTRSNYIDAQLLKNRNTIGHGSKICMSDDEYKIGFEEIIRLKDFVLTMLDYYSEVLMDYVKNEFYLNNKETERNSYEQEKENGLTVAINELEVRYRSNKELKRNGIEL